MVLFGLLLVIMAASAVITNQWLEQTGQQERIAAAVAQGASELGYLTNDYLIYREDQQLKRWHSRFDSLSAEVAGLRADRAEQQALVANIQANQKRLKEVFESVASVSELTLRTMGATLDPASLRVSWSRMTVQSQGLVSGASRLSQMLHKQMDQIIATRTLLLNITVVLFGVFLLASYRLTYRRILKSIAVLRAGTAVIGTGDLEFAIEEKKNDEIGDLSRAFNRMITDLKAVTASKADLEREIAERKRAEHALRESEQRWATTLRSIGDAVIATDIEGRISFMNGVAEGLTGWTAHEAMQRPVEIVFRIINEYSRLEADNPVTRALREETIVGLANHTLLVRKNGTEVPIDDSSLSLCR
jgi:PAS domain S-box-containing protein